MIRGWSERLRCLAYQVFSPTRSDTCAGGRNRHAGSATLGTSSSTGLGRTRSWRSWAWSTTAWCFPELPGRSYKRSTRAERGRRQRYLARPRLAPGLVASRPRLNTAQVIVATIISAQFWLTHDPHLQMDRLLRPRLPQPVPWTRVPGEQGERPARRGASRAGQRAPTRAEPATSCPAGRGRRRRPSPGCPTAGKAPCRSPSGREPACQTDPQLRRAKVEKAASWLPMKLRVAASISSPAAASTLGMTWLTITSGLLST